MLNRITLMIAIAAAAAIAILVLLPNAREAQPQTPPPSTARTAGESVVQAPVAISRQAYPQTQAITPESPQHVETPASENVKTGWLYGNVIDLANSELVGGAKILLDSGTRGSVGLSGPFFESTTQEDGSFRMEVPIGKRRASLRIPNPQSQAAFI